MKSSNLLLSAVLCLLISCSALASSPPWTGTSTYTFDDSDPYFVESGIFDTATVNISGGSFGALHAYDNSIVNMTAGIATSGIKANNNSIINLYGGDINSLYGYDFAEINIFVESFEYGPAPYINFDGLLTGIWANNNGDFEILIGRDSWSYIEVTIIPEPTSFLLFGLAGLVFRKRSAV